MDKSESRIMVVKIKVNQYFNDFNNVDKTENLEFGETFVKTENESLVT